MVNTILSFPDMDCKMNNGRFSHIPKYIKKRGSTLHISRTTTIITEVIN